MLIAWIVAPLVLVTAALGAGALVELAAGGRIGAVRLPVGLSSLAVALSGLLLIGVSARLTVAIVAVICAVGLIVLVRTARRDGNRPGDLIWPLVTGFGAYLAVMLPLISLGRPALLGYVLNNDPSAHLAVVELLKTSGTHFYAEPAGSLQAVSGIINNSYPIGSHALVLFASSVTGSTALEIWTPLIAVAGAAAAMAARRILEEFEFSQAWCSLGAVVVVGSFLPVSFALQGSFKEVLLAMIVLHAACAAVFARSQEFAARSLIPYFVSAGAGLAIFGPGAVFWIGPIGVAMLALALVKPADGRSRAQVVGGFAVVGAGAIVVLLPHLINSVGFATDADAQQQAGELGNLLQPLPWTESLGVWFSGDFRYDPFNAPALNYVLIATAFASLVLGLHAARVGRRAGLPIALAAALVAIVWLHLRYPPYLESKGVLVLAFVATTAVVAGVAWLADRKPALAIPLAVLLLLGVGLSYALVYRDVWPSPEHRFAELERYNGRLAGEEKVLVNEREPYAMVHLKDAQAQEHWSDWLPYGKFPLAGGTVPAMPHTPDTDDYDSDFITSRNWILDRKHPGSRPPGNFTAVAESDNYILWRRTAPAPKDHIGLGIGVIGGAEKLDCSAPQIRKLLNDRRAKVRLALSPKTVVQERKGFEPGPQPGIKRATAQGQTDGGPVELVPGTRYDAFLQGSFASGFEVSVNGRPIGRARQDLGTQDGWQPVGSFVAGSENEVFIAGLKRSFLKAGSGRDDLVGPTAFVPAGGDQLIVTSGSGLKRYCGRNIDWVERV